MEDRNRKLEDENMFQIMFPSVAVSHMNSISTRRTELINQQKEASQELHQLTMEYNDLQRKY
jgi:hypothetical protein